MAYRTESTYRREEEEREPKHGGWKSWFGLGENKDRDEDRGYSYSNTSTYRNPTPSYGYPTTTPFSERTGYPYPGPMGPVTGPRGYGYPTSDDVTRGPWTDRDYTTRAGYGTTGDRDVYYKGETRTYGGDNWTSRPYTPRWTNTEYPTTRWNTTEYPTTRWNTTEYPSRWSECPTGKWTECPTTGRPMTCDYPMGGRPYGFSGEPTPSPYYPTGTGYNTEFTGRFPVTGDRDYPTTSRYGWTGEREFRGYPSTGYPSTGYPSTGYPSTGYPSTGYPSTGYPSTGYPSTGYPSTGYPSTGYYSRSTYPTRY